MKRICFLVSVILVLTVLPMYAQHSQVTIVNNTGYTIWYIYLSSTADDSWGEDKLGSNEVINNRQSVTLNLPYPLNVVNRYDIKLVDLDQDSYIKWNVLVTNNDRIVFTINDIVSNSNVSSNQSGQQPQANTSNTQQNQPRTTQQPQANNTPQPRQQQPQTERLTYYVNGRERTANVVYAGLQRARFFLDNGGNIAQQSQFQEVGGSWSSWENDGIIERRVRGIDSTAALYGYLSTRMDFYTASEFSQGGVQYIMIYQRNNNDFIWTEGNYVYTIQRLYVRM